MKSISKELIGASAFPIILSVLRNGDNYGYEIVQKVKELSGNEIKWKEASIYPVLKKMEGNGLIKSYWKVEDNERPRKYYTILADGSRQLEENKREFGIIQSVLMQLGSLSSR